MLIQYPDVITAQAAKLSLDGQNIYNGCCTLRIEYSKLSNLNVKYNNDKSRDYTNPALPTGEHAMDAMQTGMHGGAGGHGVLGSPFLGLANPLAAAFGNPGLSAAGMSGLAGFALGGACSPFGQSGLRFTTGAPTSGAGGMGVGAGAAGLGGLGVNSQLQAAVAAAQAGAGCVLLVSNLNEDQTECDHLFILFGVYGDVQRVKILFNKKDTALIQMSEPQQALLVKLKLDYLFSYMPLRCSSVDRATFKGPSLVQLY